MSIAGRAAETGAGKDGPEAWARFRAVSRFPNLDGLRFFCIAMVLWHHAQPFEHHALPLLDRGFMGVDFFFVLSGFLITTLLLREAEEKGRFSLRGFYFRRLLRIVPVYFFVVTCVAAYYIGIKGQTGLLELLPFYYLFLSNFLVSDIPLLTPTWSLAVEEQYYMLWPLALLLLPRRWLVPAVVLAIAANVLGIMGVFGTSQLSAGPLLFRLPNSTYAPILLGSLAAILLHSPDTHGALARLSAGRYGAMLWTLLLLAAMQLAPADVRGLPNLIIHSLMTMVLVSLVLHDRTAARHVMTWTPIRRVGQISYGIYLYHLIALDLTRRVLGTPEGETTWAIFLGYFLLSAIIAEVSFRTLEAWFQSFRPRSSPARDAAADQSRA